MINGLTGYDSQELLYDGRISRVYRAIRIESATPCILKTLRETYPTREHIYRLVQEYEHTKDLCIEGVIAVHCLEWDHGRPIMVLEDFGGISLDQLLANQRFSLNRVLEISVKIADVLDRIHVVRALAAEESLSAR